VSEPNFEQMLGDCRRQALHLEMRDVYMTSHPAYQAWRRGETVDGSTLYADWTDLARRTVDRGVAVRRVRIISTPPSDYSRFEHAVTDEVNIAAGEQIRWLPRPAASDLLLPGNDLWVFDDRAVFFIHFSGDGEFQSGELVEDHDLAARCTTAFEAAWDRGTDHKDFPLN
jgi:hypothetical protein